MARFSGLLALLLLGMLLIVLEIKIVSYGLLTIASIVCLLLGSAMLIEPVGGIERVVELGRLQVAAVSGQLDALSPLRVLQRGYAVARDDAGRVLRRVAQFHPGADFRLRLSDGEIPAKVRDHG